MFTPFAIAADRPIAAAQAMWARTPKHIESDEGIEARDGTLPVPGSVMSFAQDQEIYGEGDQAISFFKVVSGVVRTCKFLSDGRRQIDSFHIAGDVFGVEADAIYNFSAEAVCDCLLISYRRRSLDTSARDDADLARQLFSYAMRSLARAQAHTLLLGRRSAIEKVAAFLVEWAAHTPDATMVSLAMTRQDIADYLGLTIETVSRTLSHMEREGAIEFSTARHIKLKGPTVLRVLNS